VADLSSLSKLEQEFSISPEKLHKIARQMLNEFKKGLVSDGQALKMIPSYVTKRPTGTESGSYLALDLGGSNFRVCEVTLFGGANVAPQQSVRVRQRKFVVPDTLKKGDGSKLFEFFAECVKNFLEEIKSEDQKKAADPQAKKDYKMGFTFSFPVNQLEIDKGTLMEWTKGFSAPGVEGQDVVKLLQSALNKKAL
jgi:hexokinase